VIGGPGAFVIASDDFEDYPQTHTDEISARGQ